MSQSGYIHLEDCDIIAETEAAFLVVYEGESHWIPLSQIADAHRYGKGDKKVTLSVTEWIVNQKGIEVE